MDNITATSAKIKVTHNGKMADSWYGLLTTDTTTREDELIEQTVAELIAGDVMMYILKKYLVWSAAVLAAASVAFFVLRAKDRKAQAA